MRIRKKPLGDKNLVGARIESIRRNRGMKQKELLAQLQVRGVDINASALSKLEGQLRTVTDIELLAFAEILDVDVFWPVSYTHLDVYKRQIVARTGMQSGK